MNMHKKDNLVTFGIKPTGYIENGLDVLKFHEKPDSQQYIEIFFSI